MSTMMELDSSESLFDGEDNVCSSHWSATLHQPLGSACPGCSEYLASLSLVLLSSYYYTAMFPYG